jgi:putative FmdB family regulatory protein
MPIYDLRCGNCRNQFEALCRNGNVSDVACPSCGSANLDRLISRFAVSQNLTPCGSPASQAAPTCGFTRGGCARCMDD